MNKAKLKIIKTLSRQRITQLAYLNEISMGDDDLVTEMIEMFLENAPGAIQNLKVLHAGQHWRRVAAEAHKFKPTLDYMGMTWTKSILEELERNAKRKENLEIIASQISQIESHCKQAYGELKAELNGADY